MTTTKHAHTSFEFIVESLFMGRIRIVTPEGEVFVSKGYPDADKVLQYLDKGYSPKGSAKWAYAGKANHEDLVRLADRRAVMGGWGRGRGCEFCDGEGGHSVADSNRLQAMNGLGPGGLRLRERRLSC